MPSPAQATARSPRRRRVLLAELEWQVSRSPRMGHFPGRSSNPPRAQQSYRGSSEKSAIQILLRHACASNGVCRYGYTLLEVQVAFAVLGIGLAGLCPFVVMQLRQVRQLELRLEGTCGRDTAG